jgi:hypothetical protein
MVPESKSLQVLQIELRVFNTNEIPIKIKGLDCDLELNGKRFATGVSSVDREIPAFGTEIVPVTLYSSVLDIFRGAGLLCRHSSLGYRPAVEADISYLDDSFQGGGG